MIKRRPAAIYSIIDIAEYIGRSSPASAERFMDATETTLKQLDEYPGLGHPYESANERLAGMRVFSVKGFRNHLIFYLPSADGIEIVHVLHGARNIEPILNEQV